ncbi:MAG TPA: SDR family NAD(P)-dependent oxidoreductase [Streptosporangiaceae bacterium]|nr:SDR family NAD(P)-dependent oxidoreductase [Streptosporangiaceae bacterium]
MGRLDGQVAVVTGATRGGGRGIALALGAEGAVVYVSGRSVRGNPTVADTPRGVEDVAAEVSARGGTGIAVRCDHTHDEDVQALFETVRAGHGGLDVLVCNAWGGYLPYDEELGWFARPFWQQSMARWDGMFTAGLRAHLATCLFGLPIMLEQGRPGLIVLTTFTMGRRYLGHLFYDIAKNSVCRMAAGLAEELRDTDVTAVALAPGWMLCERMTGLTDAERAQTESVEYVGRAVAALAADPAVSRRAGHTLTAGGLAREYGFTDVDGRQPIPYPIEP